MKDKTILFRRYHRDGEFVRLTGDNPAAMEIRVHQSDDEFAFPAFDMYREF